MSDGYPSAREQARAGLNLAAIVLAVVAFVVVVTGALWAGGVLFSNAKGAGDAIKRKNSGVNRVEKQEMFEQLAADYTGYLVQIRVAETAVKDAPDELTRSLRLTDLDGARRVCIDTAQQFNAESRKYTSREWKSAGLPAELDPESCTKEAP